MSKHQQCTSSMPTRSLRPWMLCTVNPVGALGAAICSPEPSAEYGEGTPLLRLACMLLLMCHSGPSCWVTSGDHAAIPGGSCSQKSNQLGGMLAIAVRRYDATKPAKLGYAEG
jgi:hypothetical protein